jgi:hypothetical protein
MSFSIKIKGLSRGFLATTLWRKGVDVELLIEDDGAIIDKVKSATPYQ